MRIILYQSTAVVLICSFLGCFRTDRVPVYPLSGQVLLDGKPLANATVFLYPQDDSGLMLRPVGHTRADGSFDVTTYEIGDGAPVGRYRVVVTWAASEHTDKPEAAADETVTVQSPAEYASPEKTPLTCIVAAGPNRLEPFKLNGKPTPKR